MYSFKSLTILNLLLLLLGFINCEQSSDSAEVEEYPLLVSYSNPSENIWSELGIIGFDKASNTVDFTPTNQFKLEENSIELVKLALKSPYENAYSDGILGFKTIQFDAKCPIEIELVIQDSEIWNFNLRTVNYIKNCENMDPVLKVDSVVIYNAQEGPEPKYHTDYQDEFTPKKEEEGDNRSFFMKYWYYIVPILGLLLLTGGDDEPSGGQQQQGGVAGGSGSGEQKS